MKSILQDKKEHECYICKNFLGEYRPLPFLEEHHIFGGTANRKLSEKYGLKVYLCDKHHTGSNEAVHAKNNDFDLRLKQIAQVAFERDHSREEFMRIFGRNYL